MNITARKKGLWIAIALLVFLNITSYSTAPLGISNDSILTINTSDDKIKKQESIDKVLRHVVLFSWKEGTPADKLTEIEQAFEALPVKIDAIYDFEWGTDVSVENKTKGFTHCFVVTFKTIKDRDIYLPHSSHEEFRKIMRPWLKDVVVVDFWVNLE